MYWRKLILICGLALLVTGCNVNNERGNNPYPTPTEAPMPTVTATDTPAPDASFDEARDYLEGSFLGVSATSIKIEIDGTMQEYPAKTNVQKEVQDLEIKKGDMVILNLKDDIAQSIEKVLE